MTENILFFHGFGYDALFWQSYIKDLQDTNILLYNRGYFSAYHKPTLPAGKTKCITHSTGLFFATQEYNLSDFDEIIIYAGFTQFPNKTTAKAMRLGLRKNPDKIMTDFYKACGYTPNITQKPDINRLSDDLHLLEIFDISEILYTLSYTAYHGDQDMIIPTPLKNAMIIPDAGHLCNLL
jgi:hypothetical protein